MFHAHVRAAQGTFARNMRDDLAEVADEKDEACSEEASLDDEEDEDEEEASLDASLNDGDDDDDENNDRDMSTLPAEFDDFIERDNGGPGGGDDDDDEELTPIDVFFQVQLFDTVLRGKRWTGSSFVDAAAGDDDAAVECPYTEYLRENTAADDDGSVYAQLTRFDAEHATRLSACRAASPTFARLSALLDGALAFAMLEIADGYRHVHITYTDTRTVAGCFRQHLAELEPTLDEALVTAVWFVTNVRVAARSFFFAALSVAERAACSTLYALACAVAADDTYQRLGSYYAKAWKTIDARESSR